mgnify:CR=1 FL=1
MSGLVNNLKPKARTKWASKLDQQAHHNLLAHLGGDIRKAELMGTRPRLTYNAIQGMGPQISAAARVTA